MYGQNQNNQTKAAACGQALGTGYGREAMTAAECESTCAPKPQLAVAVDRVEQTTQYLEALVRRLSERLLPVSFPMAPEPTKDCANACASSAPIISVLDMHNEHLQRLIAMTESAIDRLVV